MLHELTHMDRITQLQNEIEQVSLFFDFQVFLLVCLSKKRKKEHEELTHTHIHHIRKLDYHRINK